MNILTVTSSGVKASIEALLHYDEQAAWEADCDVEFESAAQWSDGFDSWFYGTVDDLHVEVTRGLHDQLAVTATWEQHLECEEEEFDREEYERFLDTLAPSDDELASRDLGEAFLGHQP
jgi:hypothetical protein